MIDVCVPAMGDEGFVAWLDRVIDRTERDLADATDRSARLTRALVKFREARTVLTTPAASTPIAAPARFSCPYCPRAFGSGGALGGHIGKAHPGAKAARTAAASAAPEALSKTTIDNTDVVDVVATTFVKLAATPAGNGATAAPAPTAEVEALACDPPPCKRPGELVCALPSDRGGVCRFAAGDAEQLDRHLRRRHKLFGGDDPDDVEYRAEAVRAAQAAAGLRAKWGL